MLRSDSAPGSSAPAVYWLATALAFSVAWGIRGQFGHEYGAAMAGALGGIAVAVLAGRQDWASRVLFFAFYGAIGWSFGGSMSYMKAVSYATSTDALTLVYGFFCVFAIGFLWAAPGGAGLALPAVLSREELTAGFWPVIAVFAAWYAEDLAPRAPEWFDTDYVAASAALMAALLTAVVRQRIEVITSLAIHMSAGWLVGFVLLVPLLGLRMNPPRGDNWAGCVGVVGGILVFCARRRGMGPVAYATLLTGFLGGTGFALGHILKLCGMATGLQTNWHSVMEQLQGLFHGIAAAAAMLVLARRCAPAGLELRVRRWTESLALVFVLALIPYVNMRKSPADWAQLVDGFQPWMYGIPAAGWLIPSQGFAGWIEFFFLALAIALVWLTRRRIACLPDAWFGRGQLLFLALLWELVFINTLHVLPRFRPDRLVTEWVIAMNAVLCSALVAGATPTVIAVRAREAWLSPARTAVAAGLAMLTSVTAVGYTVRRMASHVTGNGINQVRFGPTNTNHIK